MGKSSTMLLPSGALHMSLGKFPRIFSLHGRVVRNLSHDAYL